MDDIEKRNEKDVTELVNGCFQKIEDIERKIANSELSAKSAKESADKAMNVERHWYQNTSARIVDQLQPAVKDLANAIEVSVETQKLLFEHQTVLADCCQSLFGMGVSNIAMTRCTINTIKMKLQNASEEDLSEMARQELLNVVRQLKMQEDLFSKHEKLGTKVKGMDDKLKDLSLLFQNKNNEQDERLKNKDIKDFEHDKRLKEKDEKDEEHDKRLNEKDVKDAEHDEKLRILEKSVKYLYQLLSSQNSSIIMPEELDRNESKTKERIDKLEKMVRWLALFVCILGTIVAFSIVYYLMK